MNKALLSNYKYTISESKLYRYVFLGLIFLLFTLNIKAQYYNNENSLVFVPKIPDRIVPEDTVYCSDIMNMKQYIDFPFQDNVVYQLTAPVTISWIIPADFGNLIYVSDISGGLIIVDAKSQFTPPFLNVGDNITNLGGIIFPINGNISLIPTDNFYVESSNNPVYPQSIDLSIMMLNPNVYESSYVNIGNVEITGSDYKFKPNNKYPIYQQNYKSSLNTIFPNANYINVPIPGGPIVLSGIVNFNRFTGEVSITPRAMNDFHFEKGGNYKEVWGPDEFFYGDGYLHINSMSRQQIQVYNIMGEMIISKPVDVGVNQMKINKTGIYIVKLGNKTGKISVP